MIHPRQAGAMILITGTFRIPAANLEAARPIMEAMIVASRAEEGCLSYAYSEDVLEPGLIRVVELWSGQEALDRHFATAHLLAWRGAWDRLGIGEPKLTAYDGGAPRPV